jgi:hypothetical protein
MTSAVAMAAATGVMRKLGYRLQVTGSGSRYLVDLKACLIEKNTFWSSEGKGVIYGARYC